MSRNDLAGLWLVVAFLTSLESLATIEVAEVNKKGLVHINNQTVDSIRWVSKLIAALHSGPPQDPPFFNAY